MQNKYPLISFVLHYRKINIPIIIAVIVLLTVVVFFIMPLEYTSELSVLPSAASFTSGIAGSLGNLGKIAGVDLSGTEAQSQDMYTGIIDSRRLLDRVIYHDYRFFDDGDTINSNLVEYFEIDADTEREINEEVLKQMREDVIDVDIDADNDIMYLSVTTENPFLSAHVANYIVKILNEIVKNEVLKEFHEKQTYLENRLDEIKDSLKIAENKFENFLETNSDPTLPSFQVKQLQLHREVRIQSELLIEFRKQLEIFIADNMVNLADIKVLDVAYPPYRKSRPKRSLLLITFVFLAGVVQIGINASILIFKNAKQEIFGSRFE
jgi:uncharacterized protein involved in exopolysaccharide biosynthesis